MQPLVTDGLPFCIIFTEPEETLLLGDLLFHEVIYSWNLGK